MTHQQSVEMVAIGKIVKPKGLKGELKVVLLTDFPERFDDLESVSLETVQGNTLQYELEKVKYSGSYAFIKLNGLDDRDAAERVKGSYIVVPREEAYPLDDDSVYEFDILGLKVYNPEGDVVGEIVGIEKYPANDVMIVQTESGKIMVPAIKQIILDIDVDQKKLTVDLPEGLPVIPERT